MNQVRKGHLTAADSELLSQPSIASQVPVRFANGACWSEVSGRCKSCDQPIPDGQLTGRVTRIVQSVIDVDAVGVCNSCTLLTRFRYRLHDDMRITGLTDGGWAEWRPSSGLYARVQRCVARWKSALMARVR